MTRLTFRVARRGCSAHNRKLRALYSRMVDQHDWAVDFVRHGVAFVRTRGDIHAIGRSELGADR